MKKTLIKYTTIPSHLYVRRHADDQLSRIVEEMQRPGYVLVARQMGKTNLLLNAKRVLENENRLFAYVDLSNSFVEERDCYRFIIDSIVEPNEEKLVGVYKKISEIRSENYPAHSEYERSLRAILKGFLGNLIIVLDEIDALRSASYSDNIFAKIRSNYFARTNYPELNRLTYILSGVVEPTDLIKDKDKSPFNIGEKIYLDDFTFSEYKDFIERSGLKLSDDILELIFLWANGNPRLTFDICSEVEDLLSANAHVAPDDVNGLILKKYLTTFDVAPVDHIRELIKSNRLLRQAVYAIKSGRYEDVSDEDKQRLYLYGIIGSNFNEKTVIKNKIIDQSLSLEWIESVNRQSQDVLIYGLECVDSKKYKEAVEVLSTCLESEKITQENIDVCNYNIGYCNFMLGDFEAAADIFRKEFRLERLSRSAKFYLGLCYMKRGQAPEGVLLFDELVKHEVMDYAYCNALLNLGSYHLDDSPELALNLFDKLVSLDGIRTLGAEEWAASKAIAHYYKHKIYYKAQKYSEALAELRFAKEAASNKQNVELLYCEYLCSKVENRENLKVLVESIINGRLRFDDSVAAPISFTENSVVQYLAALYTEGENILFDELMEYSLSNLFDDRVNRGDLLFAVARNQEDVLVKASICKLVLAEVAVLKRDFYKYQVYSNVSYSLLISGYESQESRLAFSGYVNLFVDMNPTIGFVDVVNFALGIQNIYHSGDAREALRCCVIFIERVNDLEADLQRESFIFFYWASMLYNQNGDVNNARFFAKKTIDCIDKFGFSGSALFHEGSVKSLYNEASVLMARLSAKMPIIRGEKYGRNDVVTVKYIDGEIIKKGKYKKFESDILHGRCQIIERDV